MRWESLKELGEGEERKNCPAKKIERPPHKQSGLVLLPLGLNKVRRGLAGAVAGRFFLSVERVSVAG